MRRNLCDTFNGDSEGLVLEFRAAAEEDLECVEAMKVAGFKISHNACMLMSRSAEKFIKSKLLLMGCNAIWTHDQMGSNPSASSRVSTVSRISRLI